MLYIYIIFLYCFFTVNAHLFIKYPPSRNSKYSIYYTINNKVNYNIMEPLYVSASKFAYPCKGFPIGPSTVKINSNVINLTFEGFVHIYGVCQIGISINNIDFIVLKTITNCFKDGNMIIQLKLPDNFPSKKIIVFWTYINAVGNREYYMDCADVFVNNKMAFNPIYKISGKELLIVNILNYDRIDEFPNNIPDILLEKLKNRKLKVLKL